MLYYFQRVYGDARCISHLQSRFKCWIVVIFNPIIYSILILIVVGEVRSKMIFKVEFKILGKFFLE